ncbi:MAG: RDD family protein [Thermoflexus sp.]|jgi:uncharacterized RDD family membrane protein YckC|nr:RDD family protein [Thermoflexus sp.]
MRRFELASPFRHLMAILIEGMILSVATASMWISMECQAAEGAGSDFLALVSPLLYAAGLIPWGIQLYFWSRGKSIGKWILGMQVVHEDGRPAGFGTMLVRELIGRPLSADPFYLGFLWILLDREHQGWHDKPVRTRVVLRRS